MNQPYQPPGQSLGDLDQIDEGAFTPVPEGDYNLRAVKVEEKATRDGQGSYLSVEFEIVDGQYQGRRVFENYNVRNQNHQTVQIALRGIKQWIIAAGFDARGQLTMDRVMQLIGRSVPAKVKIERDKTGQYDDKNRVSRFYAPDAGANPVPSGGVTPPASHPGEAPTYPNQPTQQPAYPATPPGAAPAPGAPAQPAAPAAPVAPPPAAPPAAPAAAPAAPPAAPTYAPPRVQEQPAAAPAAAPAAPPAGGAMPWEQG